jgi:hypothetical protein
MFFGIRSVSQVTWKSSAGFFGLMVALSLPVSALAQRDPLAEVGEEAEESEEPEEPAEKKEPSKDSASQNTLFESNLGKQGTNVGGVRLETGAPRPSAQTPGIAAPPSPPPGSPPAPPTLKVGGGFILAYFHSFGLEDSAQRLGIPVRKPYMEAFRAAIILDGKNDRWGGHIEFRVRDKKVRNFYDATAWLEEVYGSADLVRGDNEIWGPMTLKVGKAYTQFGKFWDDQFYGNPQLRDGLKLDANYGVSLEGTIAQKKVFGTKYWAQYFIIDGGTNTSSDGRDTISVPAPSSGYPTGSNPLSRRRNIINGRIEPFIQFNDKMSIKLGASLMNFTADFGPTLKQENVIRYAADLTVNLNYVSVWGEYTQQSGKHVLGFPYANSPAITATDPYMRPPRGPLPASVSDNVTYALAGIKAGWKGVTVRYHFALADYKDVKYPVTAAQMIPDAMVPKITVRETLHTPGLTIAVVPGLTLMVEIPVHKRFIPAVLGNPKTEYILDKSAVVTLHGKI